MCGVFWVSKPFAVKVMVYEPIGRFTNEYVPAPLVTSVRVRDVCSSRTVTVALGITLPDGSVTSPVIPPSVCCASSVEPHSATTAAKASSRGNKEEYGLMEYLKKKGPRK